MGAVVTLPPLGIQTAVRVLPFLAGPRQLADLVTVMVHLTSSIAWSLDNPSRQAWPVPRLAHVWRGCWPTSPFSIPESYGRDGPSFVPVIIKEEIKHRPTGR